MQEQSRKDTVGMRPMPDQVIAELTGELWGRMEGGKGSESMHEASLLHSDVEENGAPRADCSREQAGNRTKVRSS